MPPKYYYKNATKRQCEDAANNECDVCKDTRRFTDYALCESCKLWFHPKCLGLNPKIIIKADKDQPFICRSCDTSAKTPDSQQLFVPVNRTDKSSFDGTFGPFDSDIIANSETSNKSPPAPELNISINSDEVPNTNSFTNLFDDGGELSDTLGANEEIYDQTNGGEQHTQETNCSSEATELLEALNTTDEENISSTDEEGYKEIRKIVSHSGQGNNLKFLVEFKKCKTQEWLWFKFCDGAVDLIDKYCEENNITKPSVKKRGNKDGSNLGASSLKLANKDAWVSMDDIIRAINIYGEKNSLQPEPLGKLGDTDKLFLFEVGNHCFSALYIAESRTCIIADGENIFASSRTTRSLVLFKLKQARYIKCIPYYDQPGKDLCGSSCASIAIAMQKMYLNKNWTDKVIVAKTTRKRVETSLHSVQGKKINIFKPIQGESWKVGCENCGTRISTKNRGALNLHKCPKK